LKNVVERRKGRHLLTKPDSPELLVTGLLRRELPGHFIARPTAESELRLDLRDEHAEVDETLAREMPEVAEVSRLVASLVGERES